MRPLKRKHIHENKRVAVKDDQPDQAAHCSGFRAR